MKAPAIDVNDSFTQNQVGRLDGRCDGLGDGTKPPTNVRMAGQAASAAGYSDTGQDRREALHAFSAHVIVTEIDPINPLQCAT